MILSENVPSVRLREAREKTVDVEDSDRFDRCYSEDDETFDGERDCSDDSICDRRGGGHLFTDERKLVERYFCAATKPRVVYSLLVAEARHATNPAVKTWSREPFVLGASDSDDIDMFHSSCVVIMRDACKRACIHRDCFSPRSITRALVVPLIEKDMKVSLPTERAILKTGNGYKLAFIRAPFLRGSTECFPP